ncbi:MAG: glycosyltransferase [Candidatus Tokpelaia sp.]|nr:MAG: glycosyltransferase [Candidatus Tokpelaia sp.]KAA6207186.1 MAG: glycosyltransferase [Candidatus Tokpelaia sp.]
MARPARAYLQQHSGYWRFKRQSGIIMTVIQNIILPEQALQTPLNMYFRLNKQDFDDKDAGEGSSCYDYRRKILTLAADKKYYFNTYYNGLSVNVWKENCHIDTLMLKLRGQGRVQVEIAHIKREFDARRSAKTVLAYRLLAQKSLNLTAEGCLLPIEDWPHIEDGMLYITLRARKDGGKAVEFYGGSFETEDKPLHNVKLGLVITHFNRKAYVLPAMKRLKRDILQHPYYGRYIGVTIIDNSSNITAEEADGVAVLPNANYGGAGGFARGLLHCKDSGFSHCLFMDDDASCETESIYRTLALLQYTRFDNLAVAGAMLRECEPYCLWCKGEFYKNFIITSSKRGMDMRKTGDLMWAEEEISHKSDKTLYGGFWHFAFPIAKTDYYPFPFFVRGDDMLFGLVNNFRIVTMNGIGNFADDFSSKESPFICYLALRCLFMQEIITANSSVYSYLRKYKRFIRGQLYSYNYAHARAYSLSAHNLLKGLPFWQANMDMTKIRARLAKEAGGETIRKQDKPAKGRRRFPRDENLIRKIWRKFTWQGFLLPGCFIRKQTALIAKNFSGDPAASFRRRSIFYYEEDLSHGYYARHDKKRFFTEWWLSWKIRLQMARQLKGAIADYKNNWHKLASEAFWRQTYNLPHAGAESPAASPAAAPAAHPAGGDKLS